MARTPFPARDGLLRPASEAQAALPHAQAGATRPIIPTRPAFGPTLTPAPEPVRLGRGDDEPFPRGSKIRQPRIADPLPHDAHEDEEDAAPAPFWSGLRQKGQGVGLALAGLYGFLALIFHDFTATSWNAAGFGTTDETPAFQPLGAMGANIGDGLLQIFGASAWPLTLLMLAGGIWRVIRGYIPQAFTSGTAVLASLGALSLAAAFSALPSPASWIPAAGLGGVFGDIAIAGLAFPLEALGVPGSALIMGFVAFAFALWSLGRAFGITAGELSHAAAAAGDAAAHGSVALGSLVERLGSWGEQKLRRGDASLETPMDAPSQRPTRPERPDFGLATGSAKASSPDEGEDGFDEDGDEDPWPASGPDAKTTARTGAGSGGHRPGANGSATGSPNPSGSRPSRTSAQMRKTTGYQLPGLDLLTPPAPRQAFFDEAALLARADRLKSAFDEFRVRGEITEIRPGPVVTLFEFEPGPGVRTAQVTGVADDIARSMGVASARIAVVPGKNALGVELPNEERETVSFHELLASDAFRKSEAGLPLALGQTIGGEPFVADLSRMPHLLIAGTTGSGKSVGINSMILSLLYRLTPDQCRFIMVDPKKLELSVYEGIPHLLSPVVTDPRKAVAALKWVAREMEDRYQKMSWLEVRNLAGYNQKAAEARAKGIDLIGQRQSGLDEDGAPLVETVTIPADLLPFIVVVIDEMGDLMLVAGKDVEMLVQRLAQMARAAGIHVIMATQRPSVDVITGTIKANFPSRVSFQVASKIDSRTIINDMGAEQLLGQGDMLFLPGSTRMRRLHAPFVSDSEVRDVASFLRAQGTPRYVEAVTADMGDDDTPGGSFDDNDEGEGKLYRQAIEIILRDRKPSASYLQRRLGIGFNRASTLIERMEAEGIVSPANSSNRREILISRD